MTASFESERHLVPSAEPFARKLRERSRHASVLALLLVSCTDAGPSVDDIAVDAAIAVSSQALSEPPDQGCAVATFEGHEYWFCRQNKTWSAARTQCQTQPGMDLVRIDDADENAFIYANLTIDAWIGASDQAGEGTWRWTNGDQFWSGGVSGSSFAGRYANWVPNEQPDNFFNQDCGAIENVFVAGQWADRFCSEALDFVCERALDSGESGVECADSGPAGAPWPAFRRCSSHQAQSAVIGAQAADPVATFTTAGEIESSPAIGSDGTIYIGSVDGLYALQPDLTLRWHFPTSGPVRTSPALAPDGTIHFGSSNGLVYAVNPDGTQKWSYPTGAPVRGSPAVDQSGSVYIGSDSTRLYKLSASGAKLWDINTGAFVRSTPAISPDGTIYVGFEDWRIAALNPDGTTKWIVDTLGPVTSSPAIGPDGTVYVGCYDGNLYALNPGNGAFKWWYTTASPVTSSPAVAPDGSIVFGDDAGTLRAVHPDGTLKWQYATGNDIISSPAVGADGVIYFGAFTNHVYALRPDGSELWTLQTGGNVFSSPAIGAEGVVYVGSFDHKVYAIGSACFATGGLAPGAPWPLEGGQCPQNRGTSGVDGPDTDSVRWTIDLGGPSSGTPVIGADGTFYVGTDTGTFYAVERDGTVRWSVETGDRIAGSAALGATGYVYVGSLDGNVYAVDAETGATIWTAATGAGVEAPPLIGDDGRVYIGNLAGRVVALDGLTGQEVWEAQLASGLTFGLAMGTDNILYAATGPRLYALRTDDPTDPQIAFRNVEINFTDAPVVGPGGRVHVVAGFVYFEFDALTLSTIRTRSFASELAVGDTLNSIRFACSRVVVGSAQRLWALENPDLATAWSNTSVSRFIGRPAIGVATTGPHIYVHEPGVLRRLTCEGNEDLRVNIPEGRDPGDGGCPLEEAETLGSMALGGGYAVVPGCDGPTVPGGCEDPQVCPCSAIRPCGHGSGPCDEVEDCAAGLICQKGICRDPSLCAGVEFCSEACPCSTDDPGLCFSDEQCEEGSVCRYRVGDPSMARIGQNICVDEDCLDPELYPELCGTSNMLCGPCFCFPDCSQAVCGSSTDDGCGGICSGFCDDREPCDSDAQCQLGSECGFNNGPLLELAAGVSACWARRCQEHEFRRSHCGTPEDLCGECEPCDGNDHACGPDGCGGQHPACATGSFCNGGGSCATADQPPATPPLPPATTEPVGTLPGTFAVSPFGTGQYTIPLQVPPGRAGLAPRLALAYDSSGRNGMLGRGWSLQGLSAISRCGKTFAQDGVSQPVRFVADDGYCLDGRRLVPIWGANGADGTEYRTEHDTHARIISYSQPGIVEGPAFFRVWTKDGHILEYGNTEDSSIWANDTQGIKRAWALNRVADHHGNFIETQYRQIFDTYSCYKVTQPGVAVGCAAESGPTTIEFFPEVILYGANESGPESDRWLTFEYEPNPDDALIGYANGIQITRSQLLTKISAYVNSDETPVWHYELAYDLLLTPAERVLHAVRLCAPDTCIPETTFEYYQQSTGFDELNPIVRANVPTGWGTFNIAAESAQHDARQVHVGDFDGNGTDDLIYAQGPSMNQLTWHVVKDAHTGSPPVDTGHPVTIQEIPGDVVETRIEVHAVDLDIDGRTDLIQHASSGAGTAAASDVTIYWSNGTGFYQRGPGQEPWTIDLPICHLPTPTGPGPDFDDLTCRRIFVLDVDTDGRQDVVTCTKDGVWQYFTNTGSGFGAAVTLPPLNTEPDYFFPPCFGRAAPIVLDVDGDGYANIMAYDVNFGQYRALVQDDGLTWKLTQFPRREATPLPDASHRPLYSGTPIPADMNGDGLKDLVVSDPDFVRETMLWLNTGTVFVDKGLIEDHSSITQSGFVRVADLDGDSRDELIVPLRGDDAVPENGVLRGPWLIYGAQTSSDLTLHPLATAITWSSPFQGEVQEPCVFRAASVEACFQGENAVDAVKNTLLNLASGRPFLAPCPSEPELCTELVYDRGYGRPAVGDFNADGLPDFAQWFVPTGGDPAQPSLGIHLNRGPANHLLMRVTDGLGLAHVIGYGDGSGDIYTRNDECGSTSELRPPEAACPECSSVFPSRCLTKPAQPVVASHDIVLAGETGNVTRSEYEYADSRSNLQGRGLLGFTTITSTQRLSDPESASIFSDYRVTTSTYDLGYDTGLSAYPLVGLPVSVVTEAETLASEINECDAIHTERSIATYSVREPHPGVFFPFVESASSESLEACSPSGTPQVLAGLTVSNTSVDDFGNTTNSTATWLDGTVRTTTVDFTPTAQQEQDWLINLPKNVSVTETTPGFVAETREWELNYYDSGALRQIIREPDEPDPETRLETTFSVDQLGNVTGYVSRGSDLTGFGTRNETLVFGDPQRVFPTLQRNALDFETSLVYDESHGGLLVAVDPNDLTTQFRYDGLGRLREVHRPDGSVTTISMHAIGPLPSPLTAPAAIAVHEETSGSGRVSRYFDSARRMVRHVAPMRTPVGFFEAFVIQDFRYDAAGRVIMATVPDISPSANPGRIEIAYDTLDRPTQLTNADQTTMRFMYASAVTLADEHAPWVAGIQPSIVTVSEDEEQRWSISILDRRLQPKRDVDALGNATEYAYGPFGLLRRVTDSEQHERSFEYDVAERVREVSDPNAGESSFLYTPFDEVREYANGNDEVTRHFYDALGRPERREDIDGTARWFYDGPGNNERLQLVRTESPQGHIIRYGYGDDGLLESVSQESDSETFTISVVRDQFGRPEVVTYPSVGNESFSIRQVFDAGGFVAAVRDASAPGEPRIWEVTSTDDAGRIDGVLFGNGIVQTSMYNSLTGRLESQQAMSDEGPVHSLDLTYYPTGNVWTRSNLHTSDPEEFVYDALNRLKVARIGPASEPLKLTTYDYDGIGNLTFHSDLGVLTYDPLDKPNAVRTAGGSTFGYDDAGRQDSRSGPTVAGGSQSIAYTAFDKPKVILYGTGSSVELEYDAQRNRTLKRSDDSITIYVAGLYERVAFGTSGEPGYTEVHRFRVPAASGDVAQHMITVSDSGTERETIYLHSDHLGSPETVTNQAQEVIEDRSFAAFGTIRHADWLASGAPVDQQLTSGSFAGQVTDHELGLVDIGARTYDPVIGRFLSPDPLLLAGQGLNGYSYVVNNPVTLVDPFGLQPMPAIPGPSAACGSIFFPCVVGPGGPGLAPGPSPGGAPGGSVSLVGGSVTPVPNPPSLSLIPPLPPLPVNSTHIARQSTPMQSGGAGGEPPLRTSAEQAAGAAYGQNTTQLTPDCRSDLCRTVVGGPDVMKARLELSRAFSDVAQVAGAHAANRVVGPRVNVRALTEAETVGLRRLFGRSTKGIEDLLGRLRAGEKVPLPEGVTTQTLQTYRQVAENAISAGRDTLGVQALRREAIDLLLKGPR